MTDSAARPYRADILAIDDTPENLQLLSQLLTDRHYKVRSVTKGTTAIRAAQAAPPDLILLDINMPEMGGYEVCERLRADERTREIPVIFISASGETVDKIKAFEVGGVDFVTKPFQVEEVLARIKTHLQLRALRQQLQTQNEQLQQEIRDRLKAEQALEQEREKSEKLLLNILPQPIAEQLKQNHRAIAYRFEAATILFADIVDFTGLSAAIPPTKLVDLLNLIFSEFDQLVEKHQLEKIKTIGDAYMVVGGLPNPMTDPVAAVADMALDMQQTIRRYHRDDGSPFSLRIGVDTGPVVAGVIGIKKFSYDLWGDAVNLASRMESQGEPGRIQVTEALHQHLHDRYRFTPRGPIRIKGRTEMRTYWLEGRLQL
ncbi:adenylate/guanylate cyclase domain-containing protein [Oscillatoria sp. CS-180]|uniref:adenylate/guanylate cyclase domain-containing protein n=1 Tax=Oscillatoria sp. CS-180 TaxID=3021720 RepID=UPI00232E011E|nr:adenylate/guanylate cyclase domain-containing protein [Oscillatoria sp. CS-180]MDB9527482.1 adenylate/guanylate cyclase domain-containing protein [Oscillatoria sp. CS-180]